jgi:hypothetical protein
MSRIAAFRSYGTKPANVYTSLSAVSADKKTVVVTLWQQDFRGRGGAMTYKLHDFGDWFRGPGVNEFFKHLNWAVVNCGGMVRVIIVTKERTQSGPPRTICFPRPDLVMRVTHLDAKIGSFTLEQVAPVGAEAARAS